MKYGRASIGPELFSNSKADKQKFFKLLVQGGFRGSYADAWKAYPKKKTIKKKNSDSTAE